jgi:hypothetical protein
MMKRIVFCFLWLVATNAFALPQPNKLACADYKKPLPFVAYGYAIPDKNSGFECHVAGNDPLVIWKKGDRSISFAEVAFVPFDELLDNALFGEEKLMEPMKSIRVFSESFLADESFVKRNEFTSGFVKTYLDKPKGLFFSKDNQRVLVYLNDGINTFQNRKVSAQSARVYLKGKSDKYLEVSCFDCSSDEFYSWLINPILQQ